MKNVWAIILAAGESRRMKEPKMLLQYGKRTIIEHTIDNVLQSQVENVMIVLGANSESCRELIGSRNVSICLNHHYREGMLSSVQCGINHLPPSATAALIFLGDQPGIPAAVTDMILEAWKNSSHELIIPVHQDKKGHPLLIGSKFFPEIENLDPQIGLRQLTMNHENEVIFLEVDEPSILHDIDTPKDYAKLTTSKYSYGKTNSI